MNENTDRSVFIDFTKDVLKNTFINMHPKNLKSIYNSKYEKYLFLASIPVTIYHFIYPLDQKIDLPIWWYFLSPTGYFFYKALFQKVKFGYSKFKYRKFYDVLDGKAYILEVKKDESNNDIKIIIKTFQKEYKIKKLLLENIIGHLKNESNLNKKAVLKAIIKDIEKLAPIKLDKSNINTDTTYIIYSYISINGLWDKVKNLEKYFNTTIIDICKNGKKTYLIKTSNKTWKKYIRELKNDKEKILYAFKRSGYHITNVGIESNKYQDVISFDSDIKPKDMYGSIEYIKHLTKADFTIVASEYKDYEIVIKKEVGIVDFFELFKNAQLDEKNSMILGYNSKGKEIVISLFDLYHSIVAGTTGFGKSNLAHVVISSLLKSPLDIVAVLLDPKVNELKRYRDIENVYFSDDKHEIVGILEFLVKVMDERNKLIKEDKFVHDIDTWNEKYPDKKMPYIAIYIEEIADLVLSSDKNRKKAFENFITRLTQLGRSTGFRIFLSTQSPKKDIITTVIKACCATRFGFGVTNVSESMVVLDNNNCKGLKKGEMILQMNGTETKIKVPLLKSVDIENIINYLENICKYTEKPMAKKFVSFMSNQLFTGNTGVSDSVSHDTIDTKNEINTFEDLLEVYKKVCPDVNQPILSITKTLPYVNIGRTKLQKFRKELIDNNYFVDKEDTNFIYWNTEIFN